MLKQKPAPFGAEPGVFLPKEQTAPLSNDDRPVPAPEHRIVAIAQRARLGAAIEIDALQAGGKGIGVAAEAVGEAGFFVCGTAFLRCQGGATARIAPRATSGRIFRIGMLRP